MYGNPFSLDENSRFCDVRKRGRRRRRGGVGNFFFFSETMEPEPIGGKFGPLLYWVLGPWTVLAK